MQGHLSFIKKNIYLVLLIHGIKILSFHSTEQFDKDKTYIYYGDGISSNASTKACIKLLTLGFNVKELIGGKEGARY